MNWRHIWNWLRGKRIRHTCPERGRVMVRTGRNSADRDTGGQWYIQTYVVEHGPPPLPACCRGRLDAPESSLQAEYFDGRDRERARRWYVARHGALPAGLDLVLGCVFDPGRGPDEDPRMAYRPDETFEVEYPWLGSGAETPVFTCYFGTWYGDAERAPEDDMDFEIFWDVRPGAQPLPGYGASW